jgi:hypothetical protein
MCKFARARALCAAMGTPPRTASTPSVARAPMQRETQDDREALVRREWREGDVQHNLAVAAMAGMPFEQARQVAVAATPVEHPLV